MGLEPNPKRSASGPHKVVIGSSGMVENFSRDDGDDGENVLSAVHDDGLDDCTRAVALSVAST